MKRPLARAARLTTVPLLLGGVFAAALAGGPAAAGSAGPTSGNLSAAADRTHGQTLFLRSCASCHGQQGEGTQRGPSLIGVGAAAVDFYLQTGRMPLEQEQQQATSGPPKFDQSDIADLDAYVGSLGTGPAIPTVGKGDLTLGRELFLQNCAACHDSSGIGYTQVGGLTAPSLLSSPPEQIAEAMRVGPDTMPSYPEDVFDQSQLDAVVTYVQDLQRPQVGRAGGASLGRIGPVAETLVGFAGVALVLIVIRLLGKRSPEKEQSSS